MLTLPPQDGKTPAKTKKPTQNDASRNLYARCPHGDFNLEAPDMGEEDFGICALSSPSYGFACLQLAAGRPI
jgi:hypothetical protein